MNSNDIIMWSSEYDREYDNTLQEIEETLNEVLPEQQYITQEQLKKVIEWKLAAQTGRRDRNIEMMNRVPGRYVQWVSQAALLLDDPKIQLKTLISIPGIGPATATLILAFYDPTNYAIGDRYMVDALFGEDRGMRLTDYPRILEELRNRNSADFDLRTVEKAYYRRYRDEQGKGRW